MKRVMDVLWPIIGLGAVGFSGWALVHELKDLRLADIVADILAISPAGWAMALVSTLCAYSALAWYDQIALAHLGRRLSWRCSFRDHMCGHRDRGRAISDSSCPKPAIFLFLCECLMHKRELPGGLDNRFEWSLESYL